MEEVVLFLHLLGALLFVAGVVLAGVAFEVARRREQPSEIALLLGLTRIGVVLVAIGAPLLALGLWLVDLGDFGYRTGWVDASIVLFLVAIVLGGFGGQRPKQARLLASQLAAVGASASAELRALLSDRASIIANYLSAVVMLAIVALMVFKP
jgi:uncharacterized membrane protein